MNSSPHRASNQATQKEGAKALLLNTVYHLLNSMSKKHSRPCRNPCSCFYNLECLRFLCKGQSLYCIFYWDKEKATTLLRKARVIMPKSSAQARSGYIASIRDAGSPVKKNNKEFEDKKIPVSHRSRNTGKRKRHVRKYILESVSSYMRCGENSRFA